VKKYIIEEQELLCLLQAAEIVDMVEDDLPTGIESWEDRVTTPDKIDLSGYEEYNQDIYFHIPETFIDSHPDAASKLIEAFKKETLTPYFIEEEFKGE